MQNDEELPEQISTPEVDRRVQAAVQSERERLAKLLHNTISQDLTGGYLIICATAIQYRKLAPELERKLNAIADRLQAAGEGLRQVLRTLQSEEQGEEKEL